MLDKQQLNSLAVTAKNGDEAAMWEVKFHFQNMIHRMSDDNRNRLNQADFEDECFKIIEDTVRRFDVIKGDLPQLVVNNIKCRLGRSKKRYDTKTKADKYTTVPMVHSENADGFTEFEIQDDLAIVDSELLFKEKITGLAAGDPRKMCVLTFMIEPEFNELHTAKLLAQRDGKKVDAHRKFIQRFRKDCQLALARAN